MGLHFTEQELTERRDKTCAAMAAVGLGTSIKGLKAIGLKPLGAGLVAALLVGGVSIALISLLY